MDGERFTAGIGIGELLLIDQPMLISKFDWKPDQTRPNPTTTMATTLFQMIQNFSKNIIQNLSNSQKTPVFS